MSNLLNLRQRKSLRRYLNEQMKNSLITGVPEIVSSKNKTRRTIKSIMFLFCTVGLFYQTYTFLESFLKYETIQNYRLEYPTQFMATAITFCNKNRINRELFCAEFPAECMWYKNHKEFCSARPKLCTPKNGPYGVPYKFSQKYLNQSNEFLDICGPQSPWDHIPIHVKTNCISKINGLVEYCRYNDSILIQAPSGGLPYKCFSLFSLFGKPDEEPKVISIFDVNSISDNIFEDCSSVCREACDITLYKTALLHSETGLHDYVIKLALKFGQMSVKRIFMEPKFQNIELFSYIGGFMGMWLGICLVTFVDFLETVTDVVVFAVMKWKNVHEKKKAVRTILP